MSLQRLLQSGVVIRELDLSEFDPGLNEKISVRVNPSRRQWNALRQASDDPTAALHVIGELLGLSHDEMDEFTSEQSEAAPEFVQWIIQRVVQMVQEYSEKKLLPQRKN